MKKTLATLVLALGALLACAPAAHSTTTMTLQATHDGGLSPILTLPAKTYKAGQRVLVTGRLAASTNLSGPRMAARVDAVGAGKVLRSPTVSTNHVGTNTQYLTVRWLFVAPVTGSYVITMRAEATTYNSPEKTKLYVGSATYLKLSSVGQKSVEVRDAADKCVGARKVPSPTDSTACKAPTKTATVLARTQQLNGTKTATLVSDVELSRNYGYYPGGNSKVTVTLYATPKLANGAICGATKSISKTVTITSAVHHYHLNQTIAGMKQCGTKVYVHTDVKYVSGNPVAVHDGNESNGISLLS